MISIKCFIDEIEFNERLYHPETFWLEGRIISFLKDKNEMTVEDETDCIIIENFDKFTMSSLVNRDKLLEQYVSVIVKKIDSKKYRLVRLQPLIGENRLWSNEIKEQKEFLKYLQ
ncbi:hypothetical protein SNEBB_010588 [Seison nebaliae]|nr:hypothetical protein SNEBB_010588 [Seison nebaliae]